MYYNSSFLYYIAMHKITFICKSYIFRFFIIFYRTHTCSYDLTGDNDDDDDDISNVILDLRSISLLGRRRVAPLLSFVLVQLLCSSYCSVDARQFDR